ncbi:glutathione ABC transporter substrate-binding protein [Bacillus shivajii]|uniref:glutathione ABC transporter substrate-binding protein n=1 Tax=Bacillus shivajii TaxID=1983719 RepID=UPI001CFA4D83|nr:glutathione ABC transporter substrate-binding protein [Bacillus shivajii]UCZ52896.1 glutathione ABC transporter substrate-binding protein [Bacillus shivajii]
MQQKLFHFSLLILLSLAFVLTACASEPGSEEATSGDPQEENSESSESTTSTDDDNKQLVIAVNSDATQLDPHEGADIPSANVYHNKIYETLVIQDENMEFQPGLATDWDRIDDHTWEFTLREGVTFHDGEEFTAEAVKASIDRILDEEVASVRASLFEMVTEVEAVDDHTVRMTTEYPFSPLLSNLAHYAGGIISPKAIEADYSGESALGQNPVGTGPFKFKSWETGSEITLEKNPDHWTDRVQIDEVVFRVIPEASTRVSVVEAGEAHIAEPISSSHISRVESSDNMHLLLSPGLGVDYIGFNTQKEPFDNMLVRQAINYAINTEEIIEHIYSGVGLFADGTMSSANIGYHPDIEGYGYDVEKAKGLLEEAGYPEGFETTLWTNDNQERMDVAEYVQAQLTDVGIDVSIEVMEWGAYLDGTSTGDHDMFILGWSNMTGDGDYNQWFLFHSDAKGAPGNRTFYANDEVDALIDAARRESDPEKRVELYNEVQEIEMEEAPKVLIRHTEYVAAVRDGVEGFWLHPSRIMMIDDVTLP